MLNLGVFFPEIAQNRLDRVDSACGRRSVRALADGGKHAVKIPQVAFFRPFAVVNVRLCRAVRANHIRARAAAQFAERRVVDAEVQ